MDIRLVVLPPQNINRKVASVAKRFAKKFPSHFVVDNRKLLPHVTIFKMQIRKADLPAVLSVTKALLRQCKPFRLNLYRFYPDPDAWIVWDLESSKGLTNLRKTLARYLRLYHQVALVLKEPYHPHITLTRYKKLEHAAMAVKEERVVRETFLARVVAIAPYDKHSQVPKVLKRYRL